MILNFLDGSGDLLFQRIDGHWMQVNENKHAINCYYNNLFYSF